MKAAREEGKPQEYIQSNVINQSKVPQIRFINKSISLANLPKKVLCDELSYGMTNLKYPLNCTLK